MSVIPTGGHSTGHQAIVVRGTGDGAQTLVFFGDLFMRPWAANPRWVTAFDDFPLDSRRAKAELFAQAADEGWLIVLSHERAHPIGRPRARPRPLPVRAGDSRARTADLGRHRLDQRLAPLLVDRAADDLPDHAVRVDEELGRQREPRYARRTWP